MEADEPNVNRESIIQGERSNGIELRGNASVSIVILLNEILGSILL